MIRFICILGLIAAISGCSNHQSKVLTIPYVKQCESCTAGANNANKGYDIQAAEPLISASQTVSQNEVGSSSFGQSLNLMTPRKHILACREHRHCFFTHDWFGFNKSPS
jgi:hypothetical protein